MRRFLLATPVALLLFGLSASTALMAAVQVDLGGHDGATCLYTYDDTSHVITTLTASNAGGLVPHTITGAVYAPDTLVLVASGTRTLSAGAVQNFNIAVLNIQMTDHIAKDGSHYLAPPYIMSCAIS